MSRIPIVTSNKQMEKGVITHSQSLLFRFLMITGLFWSLIITGCTDNNTAPAQSDEKTHDNMAKGNQPDSALPPTHPQASQAFWKHARETSAVLLESVNLLSNAVNDLLQTPNKETLFAAQTQWRKSASAIAALDFYFQLGQAGTTSLPRLNKAYLDIAAHPIQPGYIDGYDSYPFSGIVHDIGFKIDIESLKQQHQAMDDTEVLMGIHAIQYLLYRENNRTADDFLNITQLNDEHKKSGLLNTQEHPTNRRRHLLKVQTQALQEDIKQLVSYLHPQNTEQGLEQTWDALNTQTQSRLIQSSIETSVAKLILNTVEYGKSALFTSNNTISSPNESTKKTTSNSSLALTNSEPLSTAIDALNNHANYQNLITLKNEIGHLAQVLKILRPKERETLIEVFLTASQGLKKTITDYKEAYDKGKILNIDSIKDSFDSTYTLISHGVKQTNDDT